MIPMNELSISLGNELEYEEVPTKTYQLDYNKKRIIGFCDGKNSIEQTIYKILNTERYDNIIYSWDYGIELNDLYGQDIPYAVPELKRKIKEALLQDERIIEVDQFQVEINKKIIYITFTVTTTQGTIEIGQEVTI